MSQIKVYSPILAKDFTPSFIEGEIWRDVVGYEGLYLVSNLGRVLDVKNARLRFPHPNAKGYLQVRLYRRREHDKRWDTRRSVTHLVATAFIGKCPEGYMARNINGILTDNRAGNVEYRQVMPTCSTPLPLPTLGEGFVNTK
jgi:hypothetical protein